MYPTLGTDPEKLIRDQDGNPVPAHMFFPRQSEAKGGEDFKLYRDGYMLEASVEPHHCRAYLINRVCRAFERARSILPKGYTLDSVPAVKVDLKFLNESGTPSDVHLFGCNPSINAYTMEQQVPAIDARTHPWRYGGTHMHCGISYSGAKTWAPWFLDQMNQILLVKMWDRYLGVPLTAALDCPEQYLRRRWYGKAGEFRFQEYDQFNFGVEYRTPSQIFNNYGVASWAFGIFRWVWEHFESLKAGWDVGREEATRYAIDTGDGLIKLVESVPGYYSQQTIYGMRELPIQKFTLQGYSETRELGWTDWAKEHSLSY